MTHLDKSSNEILANIGKQVGADRAYVFHFNGEKLHNTHEWVSEGTTPAVDRLANLTVNDLPYFTTQLRQRRTPLVIKSLKTLSKDAPLEAKECEEEKIRQLALMPIPKHGLDKNADEIAGFIGFDFCKKDVVAESEEGGEGAEGDSIWQSMLTTLKDAGSFLFSLQGLHQLVAGVSPVPAERHAENVGISSSSDARNRPEVSELHRNLQRFPTFYNLFGVNLETFPLEATNSSSAINIQQDDQQDGAAATTDSPSSLKAKIGTAFRLAYCVVSFAVMFVLVRVWGQMMPSHSYFYSMSWGCGFVPVFGLLLLYSRKVKKTKPSALDAPWPMLRQSAFIGLTYAINYWGVSTSAPHVAGPAQVIASQVPIIVAAVLTALVFKRRYPVLAWFGVLLTLAGTLVQGFTGSTSGSAPVGWFIVFALGNLPTAIWAVIFEGFFKARGPDGKQATLELRMLWVNAFIVLWLLLFIPLFGVLGQPSFDNFWPNFGAAASCVFTGEGGYPEDNCHAAGYILAATIPIAAMQAHSQVLLSREDTGIFATLCLTTAPFLSDIIFPFKAIMGSYAATVSKWDGLSAALCCVGVIAFALGENRRKKDLQGEVDGSKLIQWFTETKVPKRFQAIFGSGEVEDTHGSTNSSLDGESTRLLG